MSAIIPFSATENSVPAHLADLFGDAGNIAAKLSINQLSYRGKVWRRIVDGEETQLTRKSQDGDTEPVPIVALVVLDHNKSRSRAYYPGNFEEGKNAAPLCYSGDGVTPDADVKEPCAKTCATCPNSVKGSKITESGKQSTLCSPFKRVAVVPAQGIGKHPVMLLRLAQTSVWDKDNGENEAKGWYAWDQYLDMLRARGAKHTAAVETKVKFDLRVAYPKLLFSAARWLNPEEAAAAKQRLTESAKDIATILSGANASDGMAGKPEAPSAAAAETADEAEARVAAEVLADNAKVDAARKEAAAKKKAAAEEAAAEAARLAAEAEAGADDGGWGDAGGATDVVAKVKPVAKAVVKAKPAAKEAASAASTPVEKTEVVEGTPAGLSDLLAGWDD